MTFPNLKLGDAGTIRASLAHCVVPVRIGEIKNSWCGHLIRGYDIELHACCPSSQICQCVLYTWYEAYPANIPTSYMLDL